MFVKLNKYTYMALNFYISESEIHEIFEDYQLIDNW